MCGLFGTLLEKGNQPEIAMARQARDTLVHRGPDQAGEWICGRLYMGHRRLSILDLSEAGRQPMVSGDEKIGISVNGEIYNFAELRRNLEKRGHHFKSCSDSEVILHGYREWGVTGLAERMDGMYAAVIYNDNEKTVYAIRDRAGVKPLYYYYDGKTFSWASELKALEYWLPSEKRTLDRTALYDFLIYRYIPAPKSAYKNIYKLPPAHILQFQLENKKIDIRPYWQLPLTEHDKSDDEYVEEMLSLIQESTREQLVSDVPVGFLLSGGIDSAAITTIGAQQAHDAMTFSIGFDDPAKDESPYAALVAKQAQTKHHVHVLDFEEMDNVPARMIDWFDEPFGDTSAVPTYRVCAFARQKVTVALSGDGGDELFGGYRWYNDYEKLRSFTRFLPFAPQNGFEPPQWFPRQRSLYLRSIGDPLVQYAGLRGSVDKKRLVQWRDKLGISKDYDGYWAYRKHYNPRIGVKKAAQIMDFHTYLPDDILTKVDRTSMAVSLECRPPFLSRKLIEYAFSLPENFVYRNGELKGGMKFAFRKTLPEQILERRKQGFSVPDTGWRKKFQKQGCFIQETFLQEYLGSGPIKR